MAYFSNSWLYRDACDLYKAKTGIENLEEDEKKFLKAFYDIKSDSIGKQIYYNSVYKFKRSMPKLLVYIYITIEFKKAFREAPVGLCKSRNIFAKKMLFDAMKAYCKISD